MTSAMHRTMRRPIPQSEPRTSSQVKNSAGGYVFKIDPEDALRRFLILGTEGGTYYQSEHAITEAGMQLVDTCATTMHPSDFHSLVVAAAHTAPKRSYAIYAYAVGLTNAHTKTFFGIHSVLDVCFTGTDLFELVSYIEAMRGWGALPRRVISEALMSMPVEKLGLWAVKYRDRHGWTWRDVLRIAHPKSKTDPDARRKLLFDFMLGKPTPTGILPVDGFTQAQLAPKEADVIRLVQAYGLPWEALTDEQRTDDVWKACLQFCGNNAVLRNLANFTRRDRLRNNTEFRGAVIERLRRAQNLHPITVLNALRTYDSGGSLGLSTAGRFEPLAPWVDALEGSLEASFSAGVQSTGKSIYIGLDVSGSMGSLASGSKVLTCRDIGAALALAVARNEPNYEIRGFTAGADGRFSSKSVLTDLGIRATTSFSGAIQKAHTAAFGGTDCALPMLDAIERNLQVDAFVVITDNETWAGGVHPTDALKRYNLKTSRKAKLAVIGLTATNFSIADPADPNMMDFVGFSSDLPKALEAFINL